MESFTFVSNDNNNFGYVIIRVRGKNYSVIIGTEQSIANEIAISLG